MEKSADTNKIVWVDVVEEGHEPKNYEIQWRPDNTVSDVMHITEGVKRKYSSSSRYFQNGHYLFQIESSAKRGKWITLGENSPVKDLSDVKCLLSSHYKSSIVTSSHKSTTVTAAHELGKSWLYAFI